MARPRTTRLPSSAKPTTVPIDGYRPAAYAPARGECVRYGRARGDHGVRPGRVDPGRVARRARAQSVAVIDQETQRVPPAAGVVRRPHRDRRRLRPRGADRGRHRARRPRSRRSARGDNSNILAARVARETFGVENVVARIYDPERAEVYQRLGIATVATVRWTADQMMRRLQPGGRAVGVVRRQRRRSGSPRCTSTRRWIGLPAHPDRGGHAGAGSPASPGSARGCCPTADTVLQEGDLVHVLASADRCCDEVSADARRPAAGRGGLMRVAIAGAGKVGRSIAAELIENGHEVMLIDKDPETIRPDSIPGAQWLRRRRLRAGRAGEGGPGQLPGGDRRHRRRQGQPRRVAAGQDRVRRPARRGPGQPPQERVAVQRGLGRRRRRVDAAHARPPWSRRR